MCAKPSKRRGDAAACNISVCDKDKNKAKELAEKKQREALARQKAYAELKHTDWKAVPIKGDFFFDSPDRHTNVILIFSPRKQSLV